MFFQKSKKIKNLERKLRSADAENEAIKKQLSEALAKNHAATEAYDSLYKEKVALRNRFDRIFNEKYALEDKLKVAEAERYDLRFNLNNVKRELSSKNDTLKYLNGVYNDIGKHIIRQVEAALRMIPDFTDTSNIPSEKLKKAYYTAQDLWVLFGENERFLRQACESLIAPGCSLYELFPEEDAIGRFEHDMTEGEEIEWRETFRFGEIVNSRFVGSYEFCDYEIDYSSDKYIAYRIKLYKTAVLFQAKDQPMELLRTDPEFFFGAFEPEAAPEADATSDTDEKISAPVSAA